MLVWDLIICVFGGLLILGVCVDLVFSSRDCDVWGWYKMEFLRNLVLFGVYAG